VVLYAHAHVHRWHIIMVCWMVMYCKWKWNEDMPEIAMSDKLSLIIGHAFACAYRFAVWQSNC